MQKSSARLIIAALLCTSLTQASFAATAGRTYETWSIDPAFRPIKIAGLSFPDQQKLVSILYSMVKDPLFPNGQFSEDRMNPDPLTSILAPAAGRNQLALFVGKKLTDAVLIKDSNEKHLHRLAVIMILGSARNSRDYVQLFEELRNIPLDKNPQSGTEVAETLQTLGVLYDARAAADLPVLSRPVSAGK